MSLGSVWVVTCSDTDRTLFGLRLNGEQEIDLMYRAWSRADLAGGWRAPRCQERKLVRDVRSVKKARYATSTVAMLTRTSLEACQSTHSTPGEPLPTWGGSRQSVVDRRHAQVSLPSVTVSRVNETLATMVPGVRTCTCNQPSGDRVTQASPTSIRYHLVYLKRTFVTPVRGA